MKRISDRQAMRLALEAACEWEESLIDAYSNVMDEDGKQVVRLCRLKIAAFERVLKRYFGGRSASLGKGLKSVNLLNVINLPPQDFTPPSRK